MTRKAVLERLSICECGYGVLVDSIERGAEYTLDADTRALGTYHCGRCGRARPIEIVNASQRLNAGRDFAPLPALLFCRFHMVCPVCSAMFDVGATVCDLYKYHRPKQRGREARVLRPATEREEVDFLLLS